MLELLDKASSIVYRSDTDFLFKKSLVLNILGRFNEADKILSFMETNEQSNQSKVKCLVSQVHRMKLKKDRSDFKHIELTLKKLKQQYDIPSELKILVTNEVA